MILQRVIAGIQLILDLVLTFAALALVAFFAFEFFHFAPVESSTLFVRLHHLLDPLVRSVSSFLHWNWPRRGPLNYVPLALAVVLMILKSILDGYLQRAKFLARTAFKPKKRLGLGDVTDPTDQASFKVSAESEHHREVLLKRYREIEEALKGAGRKQCTFLSIDVVGSTKMKIGEEATAIAATFQAYEELVKRTFESYSVWKQTWTPDGVMACFLDRELALATAQRILSELIPFNRTSNKLRTPFEVRCGLSEGEVSIFEDSQLEKVADHVIDVAGHMQKHATEGALWVADTLYTELRDKDGFIKTNTEVDGFPTYEWKPAAVPAQATSPAPTT
ncbi:MAG: hypothetical protein ABR584_08100 [Candidatus Baltobacteraceae bacterium]